MKHKGFLTVAAAALALAAFASQADAAAGFMRRLEGMTQPSPAQQTPQQTPATAAPASGQSTQMCTTNWGDMVDNLGRILVLKEGACLLNPKMSICGTSDKARTFLLAAGAVAAGTEIAKRMSCEEQKRRLSAIQAASTKPAGSAPETYSTDAGVGSVRKLSSRSRGADTCDIYSEQVQLPDGNTMTDTWGVCTRPDGTSYGVES